MKRAPDDSSRVMKINIKSLKDRKTFSIEVRPTFDASDVKRVIEQEQSLPASSQRLVFGGKPLRDGVPLQARRPASNQRHALSARAARC